MTTFSNGESGLSVRTKINAAITTVDGLGTISTQNSNAVAITGGTIAGIADLAVADGGTGASNAATALTNLGAAPSASPAFTGQASFADGSAAAPSIAHTGDLNAGLFFPAADTVAVSTAGTERMRIDSAGNVGIGLTSPTNKLHIISSPPATVPAAGTSGHPLAVGTTPYGVAVGVISDGTGYIQQQRFDGNTTTYTLAIQPNGGNVGIGTTTAAERVTIVSGATYQLSIKNTAASSIGAFGYDSTDNLRFYGNGAERMRIDSSGNVGIGTSSPASKLDVNGIVRDVAGDLRDLVNSSKTAAYVPAATDNGKLINITTGGITINASVFTAGQNVTIYNNSGSSQTITQGASVTMYLAGTASTGNRTLAQRGIATILCVASNTFVCSGAGVT